MVYIVDFPIIPVAPVMTGMVFAFTSYMFATSVSQFCHILLEVLLTRVNNR